MTSQKNRLLALRQSLSDSKTQIELRDADPFSPNKSWRSAALSYVATVVMSAASMGIVTTEAQAQTTQAVFTPAYAPVKVRIEGREMDAMHPMDRVRLCKMVAQEKNLKDMDLDWRDLYAVIHAESAWSSRDGMGFNGKVSRGLAQLEDSTSRALNVKDPNDPKQALGAAADLLKEASRWRMAKGHTVQSGALSVYYNLSTKARNDWNGSKHSLPYPTVHHIDNVQMGRNSATLLGVSFDRVAKLEAKQAMLMKTAYQPRRTEEDYQSSASSGISGMGDSNKPLSYEESLKRHWARVTDAQGSLSPSLVMQEVPSMVHDGINRVNRDVVSLIERIKSRASEAQNSTLSSKKIMESNQHQVGRDVAQGREGMSRFASFKSAPAPEPVNTKPVSAEPYLEIMRAYANAIFSAGTTSAKESERVDAIVAIQEVTQAAELATERPGAFNFDLERIARKLSAFDLIYGMFKESDNEKQLKSSMRQAA